MSTSKDLIDLMIEASKHCPPISKDTEFFWPYKGQFRKVINIDVNDPDITVVHLADGSTIKIPVKKSISISGKIKSNYYFKEALVVGLSIAILFIIIAMEF